MTKAETQALHKGLNLTDEQKKVLIDEIIMATDLNTPLQQDVTQNLSEAKPKILRLTKALAEHRKGGFCPDPKGA